MNKIILADSQAIFRAGTAKVLAMDEDLRIIAQCTDLDRMHHAITTFPGSIVLFAASLRPDMARLRMLLETTGSRGIVIAENNENAGAYLQQGFRGVVFRSVTGPALVECVRRWPPATPGCLRSSWWPTRPRKIWWARASATGSPPRRCASSPSSSRAARTARSPLRLKTTEQVIKNYLRSIYDKTGVSDRLELALFTIHHRVLARPPPRWAASSKPRNMPRLRPWRKAGRQEGCLS